MPVPDLHTPPQATIEMIRLTDDYMKRSMALAVPGARWNPDEKAYTVNDPDARSAAVICRLFPELTDVHPELTILRDELLTDARPFDNASAADLSIDAPIVREVLTQHPCVRCAALPDAYYEAKGYAPNRIGGDPGCPICHGDCEHGGMYPFQSTDLGYIAAVLRKHSSAEIAWERGLGKTMAGCALMDDTVAQRVMIVAPNTSKEVVWKDELEKFLPHLTDHIHVMPNGKPEKREKLIQHITTTHEPVVLICHYEALNIVAQSRSQGRGWKRMPTWDIVIADESHRLANNQTKQHRALMKVPCDGKLSLTGSMIQNHPEEFFGRLRWMFPGVYKRKYADWCDRYLEYVSGDYGKILIGPYLDRVEDMRNELGVFTVYRRKSDELDLPPTIEEDVLVELTPRQQAAYDQLRDTCVATLDSGEQIVALQPVVMLTRLRQLATGMSLLSGEIDDSSKLDKAVELVLETPEDHFVCFSWYKTAATALVDRLERAGVQSQLVTGDTTHAQRRDRIRAYQSGDGGQVFVGTIATLGESVNLHRANQGIFIDRSWNPAQNDQAKDRYNRIGQSKPVRTRNLVAAGTVDQLNMSPTLSNKVQIRRMILGGL